MLHEGIDLATEPGFDFAMAQGIDLAREQSYPTPFQNSSLLPLLLMALALQKHTPDTKRFFQRQYDYIVVGAGAAGSVVAARLSEDPSKTVLLLEAGKSPPLLTDLLAAQPFFIGTDLFWDYFSEPQKYAAFGHKNRRVRTPMGKSVGGSSSVNGAFYIRGNRQDYNDWKKMGANGWDWCDVFPYFLIPENNTDPEIANNGFHSTGGPMTIGKYPTLTEHEEQLEKAATSQGYKFRDINGAHQSGFVCLQGDIKQGQRASVAKGYLVPIEDRPNLDIVSGAYVTKIMIANRTAWGVQFDFEGFRYEVRAKSEVILSAGVFNTPQLLMLSGIGPRKTLEKFGIPVIADLPVGKGFHNHGATGVNFYSTKNLPTFIEKVQDPENIWKFINQRVGPLTGLGNFGMALLADNFTAQQHDLPEYHVYFFEGQWRSMAPYGLSQEVYESLYGPYLNKPTVFCIAQDLIAQSRGYVSIRSANPYDPPVIDPNYYQVRQDLLRVVQGMKTCYKIMDSPYMKELGFRPFETVMPGCEEVYDPDEYLECYARSLVVSIQHYVSTARMGDICDPNTVVDTQLRVKGIRGLRVVDASVIPKVPRATPESPVIMIAEKASDMIKGCFDVQELRRSVFFL